MSAKILIIGIGNRFRGDDALGCVLADQIKELAAPDVEVITHSGEPASLIDLWQSRDCVILVDAVSSRALAGTVHYIDLQKHGLPDQFRSYSTHAFGIAEAIELARVLEKLPPKIVFYGVEGKSFSATETISPEILLAMEETKKRIEQEIKETSHA